MSVWGANLVPMFVGTTWHAMTFFGSTSLPTLAWLMQKVPYCLNKGPSACTNDGYQFGLTQKPVDGGKISAPYNDQDNDNRYALQSSPYKDLFQCGVELWRNSSGALVDVKLSTWENKDVHSAPTCNGPSNSARCTLKGLPNDLIIITTGNVMSKIDFEYADSKNPNHFMWDSFSSGVKGVGRGPWTDPPSDPCRDPSRYCEVRQQQQTNTGKQHCWFPCYRNADGK
jgi:hypothetical protein